MLRLSGTMIVSELPVEIIDMVLRGLCTADQIHAGLVCHQWHQITLPYIWRNIEVSGTRGPEHLRNPKDFLSAVIQKTPTSNASLIQRLILHEVQLDILVVVQFLESLPRLRALDLSWITLHSLDDTTQEQWKNIRRFRLDEFSISCNSDSGSARLAEMQLLDLFSEIRQLCMDCRLYNQELAAASTPADAALDTLITARRHSVCELVVDLGSVMPPHLNLLFQRNAFRDLTCLTFSIHDLDGLQCMNTLLCMAADTLVELYLELCWDLELDNFDEDIVIFWDEPTAVTEGAARRQFVTNTLRTGLAKCTNLHAFRLQMSSTAPGEADLELPVLTELAAQGWLMAIGIIGLVHPGGTHNRLRHLSLQYWSQVFDSWTEKEVKFDQFSWDELRTVCRRFTNLRSLSVEFSRRLEDAPEVLWWQDDVLLELKEFEVFVCEDAFWVCEEPSCAIYAQLH